MEINASIFKHNFDKEMLDQIDSLRVVRLNLAENMLKNMESTAMELENRGLMDQNFSRDELRGELESQIATLRSRLERPDVVYADEVRMYTDLLENADLVDEIPIG